jgi:hypothetical protein
MGFDPRADQSPHQRQVLIQPEPVDAAPVPDQRPQQRTIEEPPREGRRGRLDERGNGVGARELDEGLVAVPQVEEEAKREQEIAVTKANQELAVAKLKLDAAMDEAAAIVAKGQGEAEVIHFDNAAEAAGWKRSVEAFGGSGAQYAQYVLFQKLSSAYRKIMVNTADSPIMKIFDSYNEQVKDAPAKN